MRALRAVSVLVCFASCTYGQPRPYLYLSTHPSWAGSSMTDFASEIVWAGFADSPNDTPVTCAQRAATNAAALIGTGYANPDHVSIWIQNLGAPNMYPGGGGAAHRARFFDTADKWPIGSVAWQGIDPPGTDPLWYMQPWLEHGIPKVTAWMQQFVAEYVILGGPEPARACLTDHLFGACTARAV